MHAQLELLFMIDVGMRESHLVSSMPFQSGSDGHRDRARAYCFGSGRKSLGPCADPV